MSRMPYIGDEESGKWSRKRERLLAEGVSYRSLIFTALLILTCILAVFLVVYTLMYSFFRFGLLSYVLIAAVILSGFAAYSLYASGKVRTRKLLLGLTLLVVVALAIYATWSVLTPSWSFEITTDKPVYTLGENVQITVTLKNKGYVSHSFTAAVDNPVLVSIEYVNPNNPTVKYQVWYTPYQKSETTFTVSPNQPFTRTCTWNQTDIQGWQFWNTTYMAGTYYIEAFIPKKEESFPIISDHALFLAWVYINVTAT